MLASAAYAVPERPPKTNFGPRKKKLTVARLKEAYGKPYFHLTYDEPMTETVANEKSEKLAKIHYDEEIAFKIDGYLVTYYFSKGKFLARVIKGNPADTKLPKLLPD